MVADALECRIVLNHSVGRAPSVLLAGLTPRVQAVGNHQSAAIAPLINKAFDSFVQDFDQARATYLSTLSTSSTTPAPAGTLSTTAITAFENYTHFRVELLAQQVVSSALQSSLGTSKQKGQGPTLPALVMRYINGVNSNGMSNGGTLLKALFDSTPGPGSSQAAAALDSLAQDQAIASARVGVLNGLNIIRTGDFGNSNNHHN
jgi:hypothetical protein